MFKESKPPFRWFSISDLQKDYLTVKVSIRQSAYYEIYKVGISNDKREHYYSSDIVDEEFCSEERRWSTVTLVGSWGFLK